MTRVFRLMAVAAAVICLSGAAFAQTAATGNIEGVVTDATGAVLPGVTVVVKNTETNVTREVTYRQRRPLPCDGAAARHVRGHRKLAGFQAPALGRIDVLVGQTQAVDLARCVRPA